LGGVTPVREVGGADEGLSSVVLGVGGVDEEADILLAGAGGYGA